MRFVKAMLAGVLAFVIVSVVYIAVMDATIPHCAPADCGIYIDWWAVLEAPSYLLGALAAFALGFWWAFRHASRQA